MADEQARMPARFTVSQAEKRALPPNKYYSRLCEAIAAITSDAHNTLASMSISPLNKPEGYLEPFMLL